MQTMFRNHRNTLGAGVIALAGFAFVGGSASAQNIVQDPNFNAATSGLHVAGTGTAPLGDGVWTTTAGASFVSSGNINANHDLDLFNGFTNATTVEQILTTIPTDTYDLSFNFGNRHTPGDVENIRVTFGGFIVANFNPITTGGGVFSITNLSPFGASAPLDFILTSTAFNPAANNNDFIYINGVTVTPNAPVPEASTTVSFGLLLALGLGGLAVASKRKKLNA